MRQPNSEQLRAATTSWDLIRAFLALHRTGSYQAAADTIHVDDSTLRRRIQSLEAEIGVALFLRSNGRWALAPGQTRMLEAAMRMEEAARQFAPVSGAYAGLIRISMLDVIADWLVPAFREFESRFPEVVLNITTETQFVDLEREGVDMAVRLARPQHGMGNLRIRKFGQLDFAPYAHPDYLAWHAHESGRDAGSARHRIIGNSIQFAHYDHSFALGNVNWLNLGIDGQVTIWSDSLSLMLRLCENAAGVALLPVPLARNHPQLVQVSSEAGIVPAEAWLVSRLDLRSDWQRELVQLMAARLQAIGIV